MPCQGRSTVAEEEGVGGDGSGLGPREFKALEGLVPTEARMLVTALVEDATAFGIGDMLRKQEAAKQVCCLKREGGTRTGGGAILVCNFIDKCNIRNDGAVVGSKVQFW